MSTKIPINPDDGLAVQDLSTLDITQLTPLSPQVISRQATINIGTIGHVAHGKSTVVRSLTGAKTQRYKFELERNITIKLGYANAKVYKAKCVNEEDDMCIDELSRYCSMESTKEDEWEGELNGKKVVWQLQRHISFVDCPGHDVLMATMLNGAAVMDAALLLVAAGETCPQPQTAEHVAAVEIMKLQNLIVLQNKTELVSKERAKTNMEEIKKFVEGTPAAKAPILPISAVLKYNIDVLARYLCTHIPLPPRDFRSKPQMIVIRSFDVNKPGEQISDIKGGVAGGSITKGVLKKGMEVELRPGVVSKVNSSSNTGSGNTSSVNGYNCKILKSRIVSLQSETTNLEFAVPGGLIAVGLGLDPTLSRQDHLVGNILGVEGGMPEIFVDFEVQYYLMRRLVGVKGSANSSSSGGLKVKKLSSNEMLLLNVGSTHVGGKVISTKDASGESPRAKIEFLNTPVCCQIGDKIAISRRVEKHWRLIGWGQVVKGTTYKVE